MRPIPTCLVVALFVAACSATPSPSNSHIASASSTPSPTPGPADELAGIAWWELQWIGFGVIPEAPPEPNPLVQPLGFRELTIGTLDGRVTAVLALHDGWSHSSVTGPYGTDVLVADDTGAGSEVFTVDATDGSRHDLFTTDAIVPAAAIGDGGTAVYYLELDRATMRTTGLFRRALVGGPPKVVLAGTITEPSEEPAVYWVAADPLVDLVVAQWCFGEVRCTTHVVEPTSGAVLTRDDLGWRIGSSSQMFFANGLGSNDSAWALNVRANTVEAIRNGRRAVPVAINGTWTFVRGAGGVADGRTVVIEPDGHERPIPGEDPEFSELATLGESRGVGLPPGWVLRWPRSQFFSMSDPPPSVGGQLINVASAQRVGLLLPALDVRVAPDCDVLPPAEMPGGQPPGSRVLELIDGRRTVTWGSGENRVALGVGWDVFDGQAEDADSVTVRGEPGRLTLIGDEGVGEVAFAFRIDGCDYSVWLAPGTTLEAARVYAERY